MLLHEEIKQLKVIALTFGEKIVAWIFGCCIDSKSLCYSLENVVWQKHALCFMFLEIQLNLSFKLFELSIQKSSPTFVFCFCWIWVLCVCIMHFLLFVSLPCLFHIIDPKNFRFEPTFPIPNVNLILTPTFEACITPLKDL